MAERSAILTSVLFLAACSKDIAEPAWSGSAASGGDEGGASEGEDSTGSADDDGGDGTGNVDDDGGSGPDGSSTMSSSDGGSDPSAGDSGDADDGGGSGGTQSCDEAQVEVGTCGCGFADFACETSYVDPEGTEGPIPPLCGGGSGVGNGAPTECFGGNFGTYSDVDSFCNYIVARWTYLENECGNFGTATLSIDPSLMAIAGDEAQAVASGACPKGEISCGGTPCGALDGPRFFVGSGANFMYIDSANPAGLSKDSMFTVPETAMITQANALWSDQMGNPIYERACQFTSEFANATLYHYCNWEGMGVYGDPSTQPTRVGCGTAVDTNGITWRVVKLGA